MCNPCSRNHARPRRGFRDRRCARRGRGADVVEAWNKRLFNRVPVRQSPPPARAAPADRARPRIRAGGGARCETRSPVERGRVVKCRHRGIERGADAHREPILADNRQRRKNTVKAVCDLRQRAQRQHVFSVRRKEPRGNQDVRQQHRHLVVEGQPGLQPGKVAV